MAPSSSPATDRPPAGSEPDPEGGALPPRRPIDDRSDHGWLRSGTRPGISWTRMLFIGLVCFGVWLLLDAPSLQHSAILSPVGARRTVSLDVVGPIAALSRGLGLSHVVGWADEAAGRTPGGGPTLSVAAQPLKPKRAAKTVTVAGATTTTTTLPPLSQHPTAANPLRVLVVGDSIGLDLGQPLVNDLSNTGVVTPTLDGRVDTGLSRPDYFNWPAELQVDLANSRPQLVVVMIGANDPQSLVDGSTVTPYGSAAWNAAYGQRVGAFIDEANAAGAHVLWVGMPPMAGSQLNSEMQVVNGVVQSQVAARPLGATYLSSTPVLGNPEGAFTAYLATNSGAEVNVRTPDGIHLAPGGGELLSQAVLASMRSTLHIQLPPS